MCGTLMQERALVTGVTPHFREEGTIPALVSWRSVMYQVCQANALQDPDWVSPFRCIPLSFVRRLLSTPASLC